MEKILKGLGKICSWLFTALRRHGAFFFFMFALGLICAYGTLPDKNAKLYEFEYEELFTDLIFLCAILVLLPRFLSKWLKRLLYIFLYAVALADVFCFVKFDSTLTPTMLLLAGETNSQEAGEFLTSFVTPDILLSPVGAILLLIAVHLSYAWIRKTKTARAIPVHFKEWLSDSPVKGVVTKVENVMSGTAPRLLLTSVLGLLLGWLFYSCATACWKNKEATWRLLTYQNIGDVEHELTTKNRAVLYQPPYRLYFSIYANQLASQQITRLVESIDKVRVDSCSYRSPHIVLIIGESYNRRHSQLYGYEKETTPRQLERAKRGEMTVFTDVIAPWNLTSFVFKHVFSLYSVGDKGDWCDYPLFPKVMRSAGYHVTFLTNQFLPQAKEAVYDFSGGFFLNNPQLSAAMFDTRNSRLYYFDDGMLREYDRLKKHNTDHNLTIFHLKGQHVEYRTRCPKSKMKFTKDDYDRPKLKEREVKDLAFYDNALRYNDYIVDEIIRRFEEEDAIVIYMPDHGEEVYNDDVHLHGRLHSARITSRLAHEEFDIPFWIWCSHSYMVNRPEVLSMIRNARNRRYMIDALPHLLMYLAGIHTPLYREDQNLLSPQYNEQRPRIIKHQVDYDKVTGKKE